MLAPDEATIDTCPLMSTSASQFAIVVPVYNVIQYLPEFLDSLDKQT